MFLVSGMNVPPVAGTHAFFAALAFCAHVVVVAAMLMGLMMAVGSEFPRRQQMGARREGAAARDRFVRRGPVHGRMGISRAFHDSKCLA